MSPDKLDDNTVIDDNSRVPTMRLWVVWALDGNRPVFDFGSERPGLEDFDAVSGLNRFPECFLCGRVCACVRHWVFLVGLEIEKTEPSLDATPGTLSGLSDAG